MAKRAVLEELKAQRPLRAPVYAAALCLVDSRLRGSSEHCSRSPWLFPSLGPTVMLFFESPEQPSSRPFNTLVGHCVGLFAGVACLYAFGLQHVPAAPARGLTPLHVIAGALSVAVTTFVLTWLKKPHPPAGATTLIVSPGHSQSRRGTGDHGVRHHLRDRARLGTQPLARDRTRTPEQPLSAPSRRPARTHRE